MKNKINIPNGTAIVTHQYALDGDNIICTDTFIEPNDCDYIIKIHQNTFVGTVQEVMKNYQKSVLEDIVPDGMTEKEFIEYLCREED